MKNLMIAGVMGLVAISAQADGFRCETIAGDLKVDAYNHTEPTIGTRVGAVMVVSDSMVREGRQTIARFTDANGTLETAGATYMADVDLRFNDSGRKGELIAGTKLGQLKKIGLRVNFTYAEPLRAGEMTTGVLVLGKRNGEKIRLDMNCMRYLKHPY